MRRLYQSVVLKRELCTKAKLSVFRSIFAFILIYGHKCWVITKKMRSRVQAAKIFFLQKVRGSFLLDKVKSIDIRQSFNIEPLPLRIERSLLGWYGHVTQSSSSFEGYPLQVKHKQDWGRGFIFLLPQAAAMPESDAGSDVIKPASSFVIQNCQTSCSMWCPMYRACC